MKRRMSRVLFLGLLALSLLVLASGVSAGQTGQKFPIMKPDRETLNRWVEAHRSAKRFVPDRTLASRIPVAGSLSLLSHLDYVPAERNQGSCGNCWAWGGTGVMEIDLDVNQGIFDRLSVQYLDSCRMPGFACCGGWLADLAAFYQGTGTAIPWANPKASYADGGTGCGAGKSQVTCGEIGKNPSYAIQSIENVAIETVGVGKEQAIANIKNVLNQSKAVWFTFFLAKGADWDVFTDFWSNEGEEAVWDPTYSCNHIWDSGGGGHAVLCVGYNDDDPQNRYWIMVNSWGTSGGGRPSGIFRVSMDMDYDCRTFDAGWFDSFYWETLDIVWGDGWETVYGDLVGDRADLGRLRSYRDQVLGRSAKGRLYTEVLYSHSQEALTTLRNAHGLLSLAKELLESNAGALEKVLQGGEGTLVNEKKLLGFLDGFAAGAPPSLKLLANMIKQELLESRKTGTPFLGFRLP